jgi:transcriptional regulator with XRE-family HTH domain
MRQSDFAASLKTTSKTMSDVEQSKIRPNVDILTHLRTVYKVNLDFLILGKGDPYCTDEKEFFENSEEGVIRHKEILLNTELKNFLHHLLNSKIVLFNTLQFFSNLYRKEHRAISKELEEKFNKNSNYNPSVTGS